MNRIKNETGTSILIPSNNEHSNILRIEGSPKGVASAKEEIMQMVKKLVSISGLSSNPVAVGEQQCEFDWGNCSRPCRKSVFSSFC